MGHLARVPDAGRILGVGDRSVAIGAADGVAEKRPCEDVSAVVGLARCSKQWTNMH